jgi:serine carboxypeptidase-like clade 1
MNMTGDLNWYDLYRVDVTPLTLKGEDRYGSVIIGGQEKRYRRGMTMAEYTPWLKHSLNEHKVMNDILTDYVNNASTRAALHIPDDVQAWEQCWGEKFTYVFNDKASQWIYPIMKEAGVRMVFYSGDTDGAVPTWGSKQWIAQLDWKVTEEWRPWTTDGQVSGYIERYEGLDFVTIKGVGHMAPQWAKPATTQFFSRWISGQTV